ncbi:hypothetical protein XBP1_990001 [Xenorhabdus bovienii str. puntauvense]|uniref:Uncharacterized protein n=1 Tax=Xenorhabdus bovienii str. puntauvense TaxID=1398201 RepID=A0A077NBH5_XENBV|nr:hypothetical protein XBP1_990001 [Xenorhabdus bovienii str. puntauvense]
MKFITNIFRNKIVTLFNYINPNFLIYNQEYESKLLFFS